MNQPSKHPRHRGYFILDVIAAMFLIAALATGLLMASALRQRNSQKLAEQRTTLTIAQQTLTALQSRAAIPTSDADTKITVNRTGPRIGRNEWVQVTVLHLGRRASLIGLAPVEVNP